VRLGQSRGRVTSTVTKFATSVFHPSLGGEQCAAHGPHEAGGHEYRCFLVPAESRNQVHVGAADPIDLESRRTATYYGILPVRTHEGGHDHEFTSHTTERVYGGNSAARPRGRPATGRLTASQRAGVTTATRVSSMTRRPVCLPSGRLSIPVLVPLSVWTDCVVVPAFKQGGIKTLSLLIGMWELRSFVLGQGQDSGVRR
jgi:hypothetical protein